MTSAFVTGDTGFVGRHLCRALEQRDMASLRVTEVWADVVISFLAPSAPSILFETPVKLAFVHAIDACNETIDDTAENDSYWTRGASIRDVTLTDIADAIAAPELPADIKAS